MTRPRTAGRHLQRAITYAAAVITAPAAHVTPLPAPCRTPGSRCVACGGPGERFAPGVHHCPDPACGAFWSPA